MSIEQQNNEQIRFQTIGTGENLVLVHGWGVNSTIWQPVIDKLSQSYCVHLVDLPGFGHSPELDHYSLSAIAETILKKLPDNAVWCGWSLGGLISTYIAHEFPERVCKLIQVCASLKFVEQEEWCGVKKEVFEAFKVGVEKNPVKTLNRFLSLQAMGSETVKSDISTIKNLLVEQPVPHPSALLAGLDILNNVDLREQFSELTMPCLSLFGALDTLVPVANVTNVIALHSSNQQVIFNHSSHAPFISESERFETVLIDFIEG